MGKSGMQVKKHKIVSNDKITGPYSFFHYIFIPSNLNDTTDLQIILAHEHAHSSQYHSIDKLISELFVAIFWFNPFAWLLHKSITEAHEFLADRYVLKTSCRTDEYLAVLYHQLLPVKISGPVIGFSKSLTFKRFQMITKQNSHTIALLKYAVIIPVMGFALTLAQSSSITAQQKTLISNDSLLMSSEQAPVFSEGSFQTFISKNIKYPKQSIKNKSHGYVIVQFVVNKEGKIENVLVTRNTSNDPLLANEVIRVVKSSPAWKPEINQGKAINLQLTMPVRFNL
jgi:TonB family protein